VIAGRIHWGLILLAGFLAELAIFIVFFVLLAAAALAGRPELARPESILDLIDAMISGFLMMFLLTLWACRRIESRYELHGALIGLTGALLFTALIVVLSGSAAQHPLYYVAHGLKVLGGIAGGVVAKRRQSIHRTLAGT
jgi:CDP-diglyceride synthetase